MRHIQRTNQSSRHGFTLVEMVIVMIVIGVIFPVFSILLVNVYRDSVFAREQVLMSSDANQAFAYIEESVRSANAFLTAIPANFYDHYGPNNTGTAGAQAWSYKGRGPNDRFLITKNYATTTSPQNTARTPVFIDTPDFDCATQMYYQPQLAYVTIYFLRDGTLYRRILTDTTTALCPGMVQQQKTSCPPSIPVGSRHASCQASDEVLATRVTEFTADYHQISQDGESTSLDTDYSSTDAGVLASADFALVKVTMSTHGGDNTYTVTHRLTKVNSDADDDSL